MTKTCPIFSQYNVYWYFYENLGQLEPRQVLPKATRESEEGTQQTAVVSKQSKGQLLNELYIKINGNLERVYLLNQQLQNFDWRSIEHLSWTSKDENGNERLAHMVDKLPSKEALKPLPTHNDTCSAYNTLLWQENPYQRQADGNSKHLTPDEWYAMNKQLEVEIGKAKNLVNNVQSDTSQKLADIDREISIPGVMSKTYISQIQMKYADYTSLLDETIHCLENARLLAVGINHLVINPSALNGP